MLSFAQTLTVFPSQIPRALHHHHHSFARSLVVIRSNSDNGNNFTSASDINTSTPDEVEIRFRRGSRKRRRKEEEEGASGKVAPKQPAKDWDSMTLTEKAVELYVGEKGLLFWLNKFAYASIFIVIGGWIVFRFVGPALNLYQLDAPPVSPASMFKG